jgi:hypothetical protein
MNPIAVVFIYFLSILFFELTKIPIPETSNIFTYGRSIVISKISYLKSIELLYLLI